MSNDNKVIITEDNIEKIDEAIAQNKPDEPRQPTLDEVSEILLKVPKAELIFGIDVDQYSIDQLKQIITWMSISSKEMNEQLKARIEMLEKTEK